LIFYGAVVDADAKDVDKILWNMHILGAPGNSPKGGWQ